MCACIERRRSQLTCLAGLGGLVLLLIFSVACSQRSFDLPPDIFPRINPVETLPAAVPDWPSMAERPSGVPKDYILVAENARLRLYLHSATSALIVEDRSNGRLWRSSPADLAENKNITTTWRKRIQAPFMVNYVDEERSVIKVVKPDKVELETTPVQGGARVTYRYPGTDLAFSAYFTLQEDCFFVTLPEAGIVESDANSLVSIEVLSFFGATHDGEPGYIIYPDGSGALMSFISPHPEAVQQISNPIYGPDVPGGSASTFHQPLLMPVFGISTGDAAYVGMISQGDFDANLLVARSGKGVDYNHVWPQFVFRRQGRFSLTGGQPAWLYQPDRIGNDRQVRYCFLDGAQSTYADMASRYRQFLMDERSAHRLQELPPRLSLGFLMGVERRTWFLGDLIRMTTFAEARTILDDLATQGVTDLDVTLWSWNRGAINGRYPQRLPVEERLGGEAGLQALAGDLLARNQRLFLQDTAYVSAPGAPGVLPFLDAMRGVDGLPIGNPEQGYLLNPQVSLRKFAGRELAGVTRLGANGLLLVGFAEMAYPDQNSRYPLGRENAAATWMQLATLARTQFGAAALTGGNSYAIPYADRLDAVPEDSTHYDLFDETIPLFQIVSHGLVMYTGGMFNLLSDGPRLFLRTIEYGAMPSFILTQEDSALLSRTQENSIYSSKYETWRGEVIRQYKKLEPLASLADQFITGHQQLASGVYQTSYEDGTRVIVNYSQEPFILGTLNLSSLDFVVIPGGS